MSQQDDGGPAFPVSEVFDERRGELIQYGSPGMSLRDHFAGLALPAVYAAAMDDAKHGSGLFSHPDWRVGLALDAYAMADAMLIARSRIPN